MSVYLAVDKDGSECLFTVEPIRTNTCWDVELKDMCSNESSYITLPYGSIKKLTGLDLDWSSEFVKI